jgi:XTP/dITP diphosphohydrolase
MSERSLLFATRNPFKVQLFAPIFAEHGIRCLTLQDVGLRDRRVNESGKTPKENALLKARAFHSREWPLVFGDDAGVEIDALNGEPGTQARRWRGHFADDVDDETWLAYLLHRLEGVPLAQRTARYVAGWALIAPNGREYVRRVCHEFIIAERPLRPIPPGAPMSAVELDPGDCTANSWAWIAAEWKRWGILEQIAAPPRPGRAVGPVPERESVDTHHTRHPLHR